MKKSNRLLCLIAVIFLFLTLCGCETVGDSKATQFGSHDKIALDGYYIKLANEVTDGDAVVEGNYLVCQDPGCTQVVGSMTVAYNPSNGKMREYKAVIGILTVEKMISFYKDSVSSYYTSMALDENQILASGEWENVTVDSESGDINTSKGTVTYFTNGIEKEYHEELYISSGKKDYLASVTDRVRAEDGSLVSETVTNYDENGNVK